MRNHVWNRVAAFTLCAGALSLTSCGGGGGDGDPPRSNRLDENFNGPGLPSSFRTYSTSRERLGSTYWGFSPQFLNEGGVTFARLRLDTYNPDRGTNQGPNVARAGSYYKGTELFTRQRYSRGAGLDYEIRMRLVEPVTQRQTGTATKPIEQLGVIGAFSPLGERFVDENRDGVTPFPQEYFRDEIDFELLSRDIRDFGGRRGIWTNIYNEYQPSGNGYPGSDYNNGVNNQDNQPIDRRVDGLDFGLFNTYRIEWRAGETRWFVNGRLVRTENAADTTLSPGRNVDPDDPLEVHINVWSASNTDAFYRANDPFAFAPDPSDEDVRLRPTADPAQNRTFFLDVDYVRVTPVPGPTPTPTVSGTPAAPRLSRPVPENGPTDLTRGR